MKSVIGKKLVADLEARGITRVHSTLGMATLVGIDQRTLANYVFAGLVHPDHITDTGLLFDTRRVDEIRAIVNGDPDAIKLAPVAQDVTPGIVS